MDGSESKREREIESERERVRARVRERVCERERERERERGGQNRFKHITLNPEQASVTLLEIIKCSIPQIMS